jgi:hypothetical protein
MVDTGTALPFAVAQLLGIFQLQMVTQKIEQHQIVVHNQLSGIAVDGQLDFFHNHSCQDERSEIQIGDCETWAN